MLHKEEELPATVDLLPDALVTVSFEGLALSCINARGECEVGILKRNDHTMTLDILKGDPPILIEHELRLDLDIKIEVTNPTQPKADTHKDSQYDRLDENSAPKDFRWIIDLESNDTFHGRRMDFKARLPNGRIDGLNPIFIIPTGMLYTRRRLNKSLTSVRWDETAPIDRNGRFLGHIGHVLGIDITAAQDPKSKVILTNIDQQGRPVAGIPPLELAFEPGVKYEIKISNLCSNPGDCNSNLGNQGTDFRFYYEVISDPTGKKFDLKNTIGIGEPGHDGNIVIDKPALGVNGSPQACEKSHLSKTISLTGG